MSWSVVKSVSWGTASLLGAALLAGPALADGMPSRGRIASAPESRVCSTSANVGVTSDYVFRGISQTFQDPAVQGGVDFTCGRFYFGFWGSNVDFGPDANVEIDVYAGIKGTAGRISWDLGVIYYGYPGQDDLGIRPHIDYLELKAAASAEIWKGGTVSGTVFYSPDYTYGLGPVTTLEASLTQALPKVGIFSPTASVLVGHSHFSDKFFGQDLSYTYWNAGVTLGFLEKWSLDLRYWDTDGEGFADVGTLSDDRFVATLKYTF
jgi:uncharacterized protein (TIGR02001 family)